ncbi:MAG: ATP-dependent DNA ligase [Nanoarchaeota archaeon]|nr:ATP-dependent DNA ligase [Nanoarchaeota archaeon]MBU1631845.1 ATP-dependent DNA ligase [Nanoarchaeota archaeon]MBU1875838.1 ATP-dependent DNA ligase [Nanoarchaeota archaeon]
MDFEKLAEVYEKLEKTSSGNTMREILSEFFRKVPKDDLALVSYLTLGQIASEYESVILGMAEKSVLKAITTAGAIDSSKVKKIMQETGDAGLTAEKVLQKKPRTLVPLSKLTIDELFEKLHKIAKTSGSGSQDLKTNILASLLQKSSSKGAKYITRIALGTLRMGVGDMTVLDALAIAYTEDKSNKKILEKAYNICPDVGVIAETLAKKGLKGIENIDVHIGRPIKMMLGQRVKALEEIGEKIPGEVTVEAKYDGERIQAHKDKKGKINLFSRRLDNITDQFPDLVKYLDEAINEKEFVVEGEVIAVDNDEKPLPFQTLMQRRRKYDIEEYVKKIPIQFKIFDILHLNGKSYLNIPYYKRAETLEKIVKKNKEIKLTERIITDDLGKTNDFFKKMLKSGYEGVIVKSRAEDSFYQAGTRGWNWIKWKKEYVKEMVDTFDLVIVGAFYGKGRRSGTYGALLCAAYNEDKDFFETFCKLGTGLSDEVLAELPKKLEKFKVEKKPARLIIKKEMEADVWFEPKIVVEVFGAEITKSPFHSLGLALRFPRFVRFREDKKAEQATTVKEIEDLQ